MNPLLEQAKDITGGPRFYPAGDHPAAHRQRLYLRKLRDLPETEEVLEARVYCERLIDQVEQGELRAKILYLVRAQGLS